MENRKQLRNRMRRLQTRHFEEAACAIKRRAKGMEPNTVQDHARIIGIFISNKMDARYNPMCVSKKIEHPQKYLTEEKVRI